MAVRTGVGLFDVSHMGEIQFRGPGSLAAVQHITMNDASKLADGQAHYSALLTPQGAFVDDILVHRLSANDYLLVVNAGTTDKDFAWIKQQVGGYARNSFEQLLQLLLATGAAGAARAGDAAKLTKVDLAAIKNYWFTWGTVAGIPNVMIARTGYSRRRRVRGLHPVRRGDHGKDVECAAGCGRGVRHSAVRAGRAQHAAA